MIPGLDEAESGAIWGLFGGITVVAALLWIHFSAADLFNLMRYPFVVLGERLRRGRERIVVAQLTGTGSAEIVRTAFARAEMAVFDGGFAERGTGRQVTEWVPYDADPNTSVEVLADVADPWIEVRAIGDTSWARWPANGPVRAGQRVAPPTPGQWFGSV